MNQFFIDENRIADGYVTITGEDANHIANVLRMKKGEKVRLCIPGGMAYLCEIASLQQGVVTARIVDLDGTYAELDGRITLFQGLPKGDKMELIVQKAVELGAGEIVPTAMTNCVMKLSGEKAMKKTRRYQAIAQAAAMQSKRSLVPAVRDVTPFCDAVREAQESDLILVPYERADADSVRDTAEAFGMIRSGMSVSVFIGPEGGFDPKEIAFLREQSGKKARIITLGHRILRTETAALTTLSLLMYHFETAAVEETDKTE